MFLSILFYIKVRPRKKLIFKTKYSSPEQRMFQNSITKICGVFHCHKSRHWEPLWDSIIKQITL